MQKSPEIYESHISEPFRVNGKAQLHPPGSNTNKGVLAPLSCNIRALFAKDPQRILIPAVPLPFITIAFKYNTSAGYWQANLKPNKAISVALQ